MGSPETKKFDVATETLGHIASGRLPGVEIERITDEPTKYVFDTSSGQLVLPPYGEGYVRSDAHLQIAEITPSEI
jgi:hypothetical protein